MKIPQKILVIGGGGYIGSMLIPELVKNEYHVRCFDRFTSTEIVSKLKSNKNTEVIIGDIRDIALENFFGIDIVVDLVSVTKNLDKEEEVVQINKNARQKIIEISKQNRISRYVRISSSNVYGGNSKKNDEITGDHIISGLVYRLMTPMTNEDMFQSLEKADNILNDESSDEEEDLDEEDIVYEKPDVFRKITKNNCQCDICKSVRECLEGYESYETYDPMVTRFKDSIKETCEKHKIMWALDAKVAMPSEEELKKMPVENTPREKEKAKTAEEEAAKKMFPFMLRIIPRHKIILLK